MPEPDYYYDAGGYWVVFKKIFNEEYLRKLGLNERQVKAVLYVKEKGRITNGEFQNLLNVSKATASRDLAKLAELKILQKTSMRGRSVTYKLFIKGSKSP